MRDLTYTEARERLVALVDGAGRMIADMKRWGLDPLDIEGGGKVIAGLSSCADLDALVAALRLPDGEYVCTRCGLREQRGETPKGDF